MATHGVLEELQSAEGSNQRPEQHINMLVDIIQHYMTSVYIKYYIIQHYIKYYIILMFIHPPTRLAKSMIPSLVLGPE